MLPERARTNATRLRWTQPLPTAPALHTDRGDWAVDQVYVGGDVGGRGWLQDPPPAGYSRDANWVERAGSVDEPACGSDINTLHFTGKNYTQLHKNNYLKFIDLLHMAKSVGQLKKNLSTWQR